MPTSPALRHAVKVVAVAADRARRPERGVVVLIYHRVGATTGVEVDLPASMFEAQMAWLAENRRVIPLDEALEALGRPAPDGPDPVVVTFDDGTADFVDVALPIIDRHRVPVTLYLATAFVDEGRYFPDDGRPASWAGLREAVSTGLVTVGSHTHSHTLLDRLPEAEVDDELDRSIDRIATELAVAPRHFAYPKALPPSAWADRAVRDRFVSAALGGTRANRYGSTDPYRLWRSPIQVSDATRFFECKVAGGMAAEEWFRGLANRRRYADATM
jgi:peptidoglycan/xylan/chitin deacetylase (PgdA/CDA1 family)